MLPTHGEHSVILDRKVEFVRHHPTLTYWIFCLVHRDD